MDTATAVSRLLRVTPTNHFPLLLLTIKIVVAIRSLNLYLVLIFVKLL